MVHNNYKIYSTCKIIFFFFYVGQAYAHFFHFFLTMKRE